MKTQDWLAIWLHQILVEKIYQVIILLRQAIIILYRGPEQTNKLYIKVYRQCLEKGGAGVELIGCKWWDHSGLRPLVKQCPLSPEITACADQALGGQPAQAVSLFRWNSSVLSAPPPKSVAAFALIRAPGVGIKHPRSHHPSNSTLTYSHTEKQLEQQDNKSSSKSKRYIHSRSLSLACSVLGSGMHHWTSTEICFQICYTMQPQHWLQMQVYESKTRNNGWWKNGPPPSSGVCEVKD